MAASDRPASGSGRWTEWVGPVTTLAIAAAIQLLAATPLRVPNPPAFLVLSIVFAAFQGGMTAGLISAAIAAGYVGYYFSEPGLPPAFSDENLRRVVVWAVTMPAMAVMVGRLHRRAAALRVTEARQEALEARIAEREAAERVLAARGRQQAVVTELSGLGLAGTELPALFELTVHRVAEAFGAELCAILELLPDRSLLRVVAGVGWKSGVVGRATVSADRSSQAGFALLTRDPVVVQDLRSDPRFPISPLLRGYEVHSGMVVIIGDPERPFGVMGAHTAAPRQFTPEDVALFQAVANVLAAAIQRKQAEEALARAAAQLANVTAASPAVLYTLRVDGDRLVPTWVSGNVTDLVGYSVEEALQPGWWAAHVHPEDAPALIAQTARAASAGDRQSHEYRFMHKSGAERWIRDELRVLRDEEGRPREIAGAWMDITERRRLEQQFLQAQKMDSVGRLAGGVAHDFNNLLTVITATVDMALQQQREDDPLRPDLMEIRRAADRAAELTRQLLAFSRRQILRPEVLDLNTTPLAEMATMLPRVLGENIALVIRSDPNLGRVRVDPGQVALIILNLAINGRDAMPLGGTLTIETANLDLPAGSAAAEADLDPGAYVMLSVTDTGAGMDDSLRQRIFEPFFTTKGQGRGTGLGLSTVYGIVQQSGGQIRVWSEPGRGSSFRIYFPRVTDPAVLPAPSPPATAVRGSETILVAEDEIGVGRLAKRILEQAGYTVLLAATPEESVHLLSAHDGPVHLLLSDVVMPGTSGPLLAQQLRLRRPRMKVLYMSGYTEDTMLRQGVLEQGTQFIGKPFDSAELTAKVRAVLDG